MTQIEEVLVPCRVSEGVFPNEVSVQVDTTDHGAVSLLADRSLVVDRDSKHFLRVTRLEVLPDQNMSVCILPVEGSEGSRWIRVSNDSLRAA